MITSVDCGANNFVGNVGAVDCVGNIGAIDFVSNVGAVGGVVGTLRGGAVGVGDPLRGGAGDPLRQVDLLELYIHLVSGDGCCSRYCVESFQPHCPKQH